MQAAVRPRHRSAGALLAGIALVAASCAVTLAYGARPAAGVTPQAKGYWLGASDGGIFNFGGAGFFGSTGALTLNKPVVGMAATPTGKGYWEVASDGGIFNFGDAGFHGSTGALTLNKPIVGMAASPSGKGYWLVASDGGIFGFGDAAFAGSTGAITLNQPIVGMAATPTGKGYWLVASDGGIFNFGDAGFHGSTGGFPLAKPIVGMAATPTGKGYWLVASDGGIFGFGDARFWGSTGALRLNMPVVAMAASPTGQGYWLVASDGGIFNFGDAAFFGSTGAIRLNRPIVAMAAAPGTVVADTTKPAATVKQATGQTDPTNASPVNFTVTFSEAVTGFASADVTVGGTAGGTKTATVTGSGAAYNVAVSGMTTPGTVTVSVAAGVAADVAGNSNTVSTSTDNSVTFDATAPTVTVEQAAGQADPTSTSPVNFTVTFSEAVLGFAHADVTVGGTAGGTKTATVTGSGTTYNVAVSGMTTAGTVTASLGAAVASDAAGNENGASTSADGSVAFDATAPTVSGVTSITADGSYRAGDLISVAVSFTETAVVTGTPTLALNTGATATYTGGSGTSTLTFSYTVAAGQNTVDLDYASTGALALGGGTIRDLVGNDAVLALPAPGASGSLGANKAIVIDTTAPVFTSVAATMGSTTVTASFSEPVACATVAADDFLATVAGTPTTVALGSCSGAADATVDLTLGTAPLGGGAVVVSLVDTNGSVTDAAGNAAAAVTRNTTATTDVTVTIDQAGGQADPDNTAPIDFTVVFSEAVTGFADADVTVGGTAGGTKTATVTGSGTTYNVAVNGMTTSGSVTASIAAGAAGDVDGNLSAASTSTDNEVTWDVTAPTVTVNQAGGQADPTNASPVNFTVVFSEAVTGFADADVTVGGTAGGTKTATVTGSGTTYNVAVSGMTTSGTVVVSVGAAVATDGAGNGNAGSTSTDNEVTWDVTAPTVTVNQAGSQADPDRTAPIDFTVVFSEAVTGFADADVTIGGTAGGTKTAAVTGSGTTYNVAVSGMTTDGTVVVSLAAGVATDAAGNANTISTSTDNSVTYDATAPTVTVNQAAGQADPTNASPVNFTVVFSEAVTGFADADVTIGGTAGGTMTAAVTGSGTTYNVAVSGMTTPGTVVASLGAAVATDAAGNANTISTSTDNSVTYDATAPTVTVNQAGGQADPTNDSPVNFTVVFSEAVTDFADADVTIGGTAGGTKTAAVTGSGTTYNVAVSGMTTPGTVTASVGAGVAADAAGNANAVSTSTDNSVTYDADAPVLLHIETTVGSATVVAVFDEPILCTSVATSDFLAALAGSPVVVSAANCTSTSDSTIEVTLLTPVVEAGTTALTLTAGAVNDPAANASGSASTLVASAIELDPGSTADGATVVLGTATYTVTATDTDGTVSDLDVLLDGSSLLLNPPVCGGTGTATATCTYTASLLEPTVGPHVFTFVATDDDGNVTTTTRSVTVTAI